MERRANTQEFTVMSRVSRCGRWTAWAIHEMLIPGVVLMENAARNIAEGVICRIFGNRSAEGGVHISAASGNNGGDGLAVARHLFNQSH
jgi:ADP-dependent NAD(P)H-hydrate dehydratase / NAD(P)H-hydrate epimerase